VVLFPASLRSEKQNLADEPQGMGPALFWRIKSQRDREENETDLVIVSDRAEGEQDKQLLLLTRAWIVFCCQNFPKR